MICAKCEGKSVQSAKCVLNALESLKVHFQMLQGFCEDNANTITLLKQRNEKLHNAIELLQQQKERSIKCSPKRRRPSPKKPRLEKMPQTESPKMPESQSSLNMNIALQPDDEEEETITETEPAISPYKPWATRRKLNKTNCENEQPVGTTKIIDNKNEWLTKLPKDKLPAPKTKMSLTLRSDSPKLKQTRLQFDANNSTRNATIDKDVIESSPNLYSTLRHAKQSRSLLQRADTSNAFDTSAIASTSTKSENKPVFDMDDDDSFFDQCPDPSVPKSVDALPPLSGVSDSSSVVMLPPPTQEIVFIDDSIDEANPPLNTMDFMAEVLKADDKASMTKLQEFEAKLIRDQQKAATTFKMVEQQKAATTIKKIEHQKASTSLKAGDQKKAATSTSGNRDPQLADNKLNAKVPVNVKLEQFTEQPSGMGNESTKLPEDFDIEDDEEEEEEEIFPRPIVVKEEKEESLKERYNIDCDQCEKFINFMGANMTDLQIREYLCNCRHFDHRELDHNTPDGFWNPHMVSFAEDDPRNKVYVDRRFVNQAKK
ncbi:uncharacterized protein LOC132791361 [Drosophila nasuta]|uniref:uncharacterized protein LOC132791361 n=1 Tax=Drosophila nasuta TaxID=42062 RepID=UPI00295EE0A9|nr:uncharacterized protein LOC132791361 [Drosophila nasuta]